MDPDATLGKALALAQHILTDSDTGRGVISARMAIELAEYIQALDNWIRIGGYLPESWASMNRRREFNCAVMVDVTADNRQEAGQAVVRLLELGDLVGKTYGSARIESWWMIEQIDKIHDHNDCGAGRVVFD